MVETLESPPRPKIGLALGSGVARGWAHLGATGYALEHDRSIPLADQTHPTIRRDLGR